MGLFIPEITTTIRISDLTLMDNVDIIVYGEDNLTETMQKEVFEKARENIAKQLQTVEPDASQEVLNAFIATYIDFKMEIKRDIEFRETVVEVTPFWKGPNMIDTDIKEYELLEKFKKEV